MPEDLQDTQISASGPFSFAKRDFRQEITRQSIGMLEKDTAPSRTPWKSGPICKVLQRGRLVVRHAAWQGPTSQAEPLREPTPEEQSRFSPTVARSRSCCLR